MVELEVTILFRHRDDVDDNNDDKNNGPYASTAALTRASPDACLCGPGRT